MTSASFTRNFIQSSCQAPRITSLSTGMKTELGSFEMSKKSNEAQCHQSTDEQTGPEGEASISSALSWVKSNMEIQQAQLRRLASQENASKGLGTSDKVGNSDFTDMLRVTEEMARLLHEQRMGGFKDKGPATSKPEGLTKGFKNTPRASSMRPPVS